MLPGMLASETTLIATLRVGGLYALAVLLSGCASLIVEDARRGGPTVPSCAALKDIRNVRAVWREEDGAIEICVSGTPYRDYRGAYARNYVYEPKGPDMDYRLTIPATWTSEGAPQPKLRLGTLPVYELHAVAMPDGCAIPPTGTQPVEIRKIDFTQRNDLPSGRAGFVNHPEVSWLEGGTPVIFDGHWSVEAQDTSDYSKSNAILIYRHSVSSFAGGSAAIFRHQPPTPGSGGSQVWIAAKPFAFAWDVVTFPVQLFLTPGLAFGYVYGQAHITPPDCEEGT